MGYSVVLAEDHGIVRDGLISLLEETEDFTVVSAVGDGLEAVAAVQEHEPDLLVLDLSMPRLNGPEIIEEAKRLQPNLKVLVLTVHAEHEYVDAAFRAGADGYLLKEGSHTELETAVKSIMQGHVYLSPQVSHTIVGQYLAHTETQAASHQRTLTTRERMVLKLIGEGYKNREIAEALSISAKTVEKHRGNLMRKLDLHSASALVSYALSHGIASHAE